MRQTLARLMRVVEEQPGALHTSQDYLQTNLPVNMRKEGVRHEWERTDLANSRRRGTPWPALVTAV